MGLQRSETNLAIKPSPPVSAPALLFPSHTPPHAEMSLSSKNRVPMPPAITDKALGRLPAALSQPPPHSARWTFTLVSFLQDTKLGISLMVQ